MARDAHDREDLLRDAKGLVARVELRIPTLSSANLLCGFRPDSALSIYWDPDDVVQFNAHGELRRGFHHGRLLAAFRRQLVWLDRRDEGPRTRLARTPLTPAQQDVQLRKLVRQLQSLRQALSGQAYQVVGQAPPDADVIGQLQGWLHQHGQTVRVAVHPGVGRRSLP